MLHLVLRDTVECIYILYVGSPVIIDKKENLIFLIYKEIQNGAVAKS
jgi:hypothetical protein